MSGTSNNFTSSIGMEQTTQPMRILLVDDDADCRMLIQDAISDSKFPVQIMEACNGMEALKLLESIHTENPASLPGLIYLDIEMPVLNGLATLERIKNDARFKSIPVVMMTGVSDDFHMQRAAELGANSYTLKPANAEQFLHTVQTSSNYWLMVHQSPVSKLPQSMCRR